MSFTGDLEHLPIVDVIQLLHATKKSGTLTVRGRKGQSQLVFEDGYIVSANHADGSLRIGRVLVDLRFITAETLESALNEQKNAGGGRLPLVAMLIEKGLVEKEQAYKALEMLIELTIVEVLTWTTGTFSLDVDTLSVSDEYRYFPEKLQQDIHLNTQNVLMDALRIYDEKKRDGQLPEEVSAEESIPPTAAAPVETESSGAVISADDLGLADLDQLERKIPGVFASLEDTDPVELQRRRLREVGPELSAGEVDELVAFLVAASRAERVAPGAHPVILYSADPLLKDLLTTACKPQGVLVFATNEEQTLDPIIEQSLGKNALPVLVFDRPDETVPGFGAEELQGVRQKKRQKYPHLPVFQFASPQDYLFSLQALAGGARTILPRPVRQERGATYVADTLDFLRAFAACVAKVPAPSPSQVPDFASSLAALRDLKEPQEVALALLKFVAQFCARSLTLIVGPAELIAERGIGIREEKSAGPSATLGFRVPLGESPLFRQVIDGGRLYFGACDDAALREHLFAAIGAPLRPTILLLPLQNRGKTVALIYGDFGDTDAVALSTEPLEIFASQAGLVLENAFYRKRLEKTPQ